MRFFNNFRQLTILSSLVKSDFQRRYLGTFFGVFWAFAAPLATISVLLFVFNLGFRSGPINGVRFDLWLVSGLIVWFYISDGIISGSGQFGIADGVQNGDELVRAIHFPLDADSIFMDSGKTVRSGTFRPKMTPFDTYFFELLGGGFPEEVFIGPIVSQSRLIGYLYGDTMPGRRPIGDLESLAIFLSQAGIAMEKSLLERQVYEGARL